MEEKVLLNKKSFKYVSEHLDKPPELDLSKQNEIRILPHSYPKGVTDPEYCVLRFTAEQGRFYSNISSQNFEIE